uniref:Adenylosuccinate lyase n=1 Tax=Parascaris univalens TaxID=6257 RepID=A0A915CE85_PARUN
MDNKSTYESVLKERWCRQSPLLSIFSEKNKIIVWRQMWIWLAEAERELGLKQVTQAAIEEMLKSKELIDWESVREEEKHLKHDVMAHNHVYGKMCPKARGIIHLGATSCFVQDNTDLILQRQALDVLLKRLAICLVRLADFAELTKEVVTVGRTHYQTASLVTVGKRATIWAQDLLVAFKQLEKFRDEMRFRGVKGATGTQDSFMALFNNDEEKVCKLDDLITAKAGFAQHFNISGQTYPRHQDCLLFNALALLGASVTKVCTDIRILQSLGELMEPFESSQVGSSAMPYKRNPMKCERVCSLARRLIITAQDALFTFASQGLERTLDDSAIRRIDIPDSFLIADAILATFQNIAEGLNVQHEHVARVVNEELPFLALEKALMWLTEEGADRQVAHERIREVALAAKEAQKIAPVSFESILADSFFDKVRERVLNVASQPLLFTGRCAQQTTAFLNDELRPAVLKYVRDEDLVKKVTLDV